MNTKIYIIEAHKNPPQLKRLIEKLNDDLSYFYIHIDKKSNIEDFTKIISGKNINFLTTLVDCIWCDISQVEATVLMIEEVLKDKREGMVILLSGQDYPIKSNQEISKFIDENIEYNFIDTVPVEINWKYTHKEKTQSYRFNLSSSRGDSIVFRKISKQSLKAFFKGTITLKQLLLLLKKRKLKLKIEQYGGSTWWAINTKSLKKMYDYIKENKKALFSYFKYTYCPDEIFFHTIMQHLSEIDETVKNRPTFTYTNWNRGKETFSSPVTFTEKNFEELTSQPENKLLARKFDMENDSKILDMLDKYNTNIS
ncbi:MAG: beta-1,6-N-acetylglucosaminyltransferase [Prevotellaceae bacterium]|jgi:hypothetical protein|nr:beta-1,6-N-acetylglucosaminyltransferase [Prevotellaceae bacterium]